MASTAPPQVPGKTDRAGHEAGQDRVTAVGVRLPARAGERRQAEHRETQALQRRRPLTGAQQAVQQPTTHRAAQERQTADHLLNRLEARPQAHTEHQPITDQEPACPPRRHQGDHHQGRQLEHLLDNRRDHHLRRGIIDRNASRIRQPRG